MIADLIADLQGCRTERECWRIQIDAERWLTPLEACELIAKKASLPPTTHKWLDRFGELLRLAGPTPRKYLRRSISSGANFFSDPMPRSASKVLIVGFCGHADRLMMPIACFLQTLPSEYCDVVVLRDSKKTHYLNGVEGYADSVFDLARRVKDDFAPQNYARTYCFGTSSGGFGALRCGLLLNSHRAISIGGRRQWYVRGLIAPGEPVLPAFDPLCACMRRRKTKLICAYARENPEDRGDAEKIAAILPVERLELPGSKDHNLLFTLLEARGLPGFFKKMFELDLLTAGADRMARP